MRINKDRENENAENREQTYAVSQCDFAYVIGVQIEIIPCDNLNKMSWNPPKDKNKEQPKTNNNQ